ncbi:hypothetical protein KSP40_PGU007919 [Platanthera guangdongensis]|uniref:Sulfite exporter TauE/SafE family protein n=1 Tax=Platanthera guangdongensis TaxID=2320717 RepID=A0ABR2MI88_9ASPA
MEEEVFSVGALEKTCGGGGTSALGSVVHGRWSSSDKEIGAPWRRTSPSELWRREELGTGGREHHILSSESSVAQKSRVGEEERGGGNVAREKYVRHKLFCPILDSECLAGNPRGNGLRIAGSHFCRIREPDELNSAKMKAAELKADKLNLAELKANKLSPDEVPIALSVTVYEAVSLIKGKRAIASRGKQNMCWKGFQLFLYCCFGVLAGIVGGLLGLGGGFILGPLFLEMGVPPQVASATSTFAMTFSSSMSVIQYYLLDRFPVPYASYFVFLATVAAFTGQHIVRKLIVLLGRASLIIFILALTIFVSAISLEAAILISLERLIESLILTSVLPAMILFILPTKEVYGSTLRGKGEDETL